MPRRSKSVSVVSQPGPASSRVSEKEDPWIWLEGLRIDPEGNEVWSGLYCFRRNDVMKARGVLRHILSLDSPGRELAGYEDFRLPETVLHGSLSDSEPTPAQSVPEPKPKAEKAPQKAPKAKCGAELRGDPCIRKPGHFPGSMHKTEAGRKWRR